MKKIINAFIVIVAVHFVSSNAFAISQAELQNAKEKMVQESISSYPGNCPCPFNSMRNGRRCGGRSAYSKPGGYTPLCYIKDISDKDAENYLKKSNI